MKHRPNRFIPTLLLLATSTTPLSVAGQDVTGWTTFGRLPGAGRAAVPMFHILTRSDPMGSGVPQGGQGASDSTSMAVSAGVATDDLERVGGHLLLTTRTRPLRLSAGAAYARVRGIDEVHGYEPTGRTIDVGDARLELGVRLLLSDGLWAGVRGQYSESQLADLSSRGGELLAEAGWTRGRWTLAAEGTALRFHSGGQERPAYATVLARTPLPWPHNVQALGAVTWSDAWALGPELSWALGGEWSPAGWPVYVQAAWEGDQEGRRSVGLGAGLTIARFRVAYQVQFQRPGLMGSGVSFLR